MYCASGHGITYIYQLDSSDKKHRITVATISRGSVNPTLGFYVWNLAMF